jgi:hypothetical protein
MKLYHGGLIAVESPRIIQSDFGRDFGFAFYTTDIKEQAERWALRRQKSALHNKDIHAKAMVSVFDFDMDAARQQLEFLDFPQASMEWLDLVVACRSNTSYSHGKDIIAGKIADDNVGETITYVLSGIMRKEDALERLKFQKINNQLAFCTDRSLLFLKYDTCYIVENIND